MFAPLVASRRRAIRGVALLTACAAPLGLASCRAKTPDPDPRMVSEWVHALYGTIRVERLSPPVASRLTAYATMALYAGTAATHATLKPLHTVVTGLEPLPAPAAGDVDATLVAVAAERTVLDSLLREALPTTRSALGRLADSLQTARRAQGVTEPVAGRSDSLGRAIGLALVAYSRGDHFSETRTMAYAPATGDSLWINDAPATLYATTQTSAVSEVIQLDNPANQQRTANTSDRSLILSRPKVTGGKTLPAANIAGITEPFWGGIRSFVNVDTGACPSGPPPAYGTDSTAALYFENAQVYRITSARTAEQKEIGYYWADNAGETGTPVGHWLSIAAQMISERHLTGEQAVQLVTGTAIAQADAFIAAWRVKFGTMTLRPRTFIRRHIDPSWEPLIPTPPFPEFPSGHSTQSGAASAVITALIGAGPFSDSTSISIGHAVRHFPSFIAASEEAGKSRVYAGLHYEWSNQAGLRMGRCIGNAVAKRLDTKAAP
jgi:hypothetical protein